MSCLSPLASHLRVTCFALVCLAVSTADGGDITVQLKLHGQHIEGTPLAWSSSDVVLLGRDGHLWSFSPDDASDYRRTSSSFRSYSQREIRGHLLREFGGGYEVSGTGHYLVVHPKGQRNQWAPRFEKLYRSFIHYFTARGWRPDEPQFPLVAVVFPRESDFRRYASRQGARMMPGTLGYYSPTTNRILLYDSSPAGRSDAEWHLNAETIIHEATHQTAFNTGFHSRFAAPPRWVAEGLATMFEARGVWNSRQYPQQKDRINDEQRNAFMRYAAGSRRKGSLAEFVATDRIFQTNPEAAYAEAWALTFFLVETMPQKYIEYLRQTASREDFTRYSDAERVQDFTDAFGRNLPVLEAHFLRHMKRN